MTGLRPDGLEMAEAITDALRQGRLVPERRSATSTRTARAPSRTTGTRRPRSSGPRASTRTRCRSARSSRWSATRSAPSASIEMAACALAIEHGVVPPTANWSTRDPECDLDYMPNEARELPVDVALSVGSGFGGFQSAMVFRRLPDGGGRSVAPHRTAGRAVVTGIGVVAPTGIGADAHWRTVLGRHPPDRADHAVRPGRLSDPLRRRGARLRPPTPTSTADSWCRPTGGRTSASPPPGWRSPTPGCPTGPPTRTATR